MRDTLVIWALPFAIVLHNLEEALWLPRWTAERAGRWHPSVAPRSFRFAVSVLTLMAVLIAA